MADKTGAGEGPYVPEERRVRREVGLELGYGVGHVSAVPDPEGVAPLGCQHMVLAAAWVALGSPMTHAFRPWIGEQIAWPTH